MTDLTLQSGGTVPQTAAYTPLLARLDALAAALATAGRPALANEAAEIASLARAGDNLLRLDEVKRRTGLSTSEIYRREAAGEFPRARQIGARVVAWYGSEVSAWIASRPARFSMKHQAATPSSRAKVIR